MTKENKQILNDLYLKDNKLQYPSFPDNARPIRKYSDATANGLTKCVIDFLNFSGHQAERVSSMGRMIDKSKRVTDILGRERTIGSMEYIKGTSTNGTADISSTINGKSVKFEIKIGKDKMSQAQKVYKDNIERAGGLYFITKTFDEFINQYNEIMKKTLKKINEDFVMIKSTKIFLNFDPQTSPKGRTFRLSGTRMFDEKNINGNLKYKTIHSFRYLDKEGGFFEVEFDYNGVFVALIKNQV